MKKIAVLAGALSLATPAAASDGVWGQWERDAALMVAAAMICPSEVVPDSYLDGLEMRGMRELGVSAQEVTRRLVPEGRRIAEEALKIGGGPMLCAVAAAAAQSEP